MEARARGPAVKALDLRRSDFDEPEAQRIELRGCRHQHATIFKRRIAGYELFFSGRGEHFVNTRDDLARLLSVLAGRHRGRAAG
jgi:hypothetical protein